MKLRLGIIGIGLGLMMLFVGTPDAGAQELSAADRALLAQTLAAVETTLEQIEARVQAEKAAGTLTAEEKAVLKNSLSAVGSVLVTLDSRIDSSVAAEETPSGPIAQNPVPAPGTGVSAGVPAPATPAPIAQAPEAPLAPSAPESPQTAAVAETAGRIGGRELWLTLAIAVLAAGVLGFFWAKMKPEEKQGISAANPVTAEAQGAPAPAADPDQNPLS